MVSAETLRTWGADVDDGMKRCMNNEPFYLKLVAKAAGDPSFDSLKEAVQAGELERGFELAHAIKGMTTNLALTPISTPILEITELLRSRTQTDYSPLLEEIIAQRDSLVSLLNT